MDHLIESYEAYIAMDIETFREEYDSGKYERIQDCPSYNLIATYCQGLKPLRKYMGWESVTPLKIAKRELL